MILPAMLPLTTVGERRELSTLQRRPRKTIDEFVPIQCARCNSSKQSSAACSDRLATTFSTAGGRRCWIMWSASTQDAHCAPGEIRLVDRNPRHSNLIGKNAICRAVSFWSVSPVNPLNNASMVVIMPTPCCRAYHADRSKGAQEVVTSWACALQLDLPRALEIEDP